MAAADIPQVTIFEDSGVTLMARIQGEDAANVQQADITSISRNVYDGETIVGESTALTVADVVFDTLQTDARWTFDATGYNFKDAVADTVFPVGDTVYRVEYLFTPATGAKFHYVREVHTKNLVRS